jgi:hypothetical protein
MRACLVALLVAVSFAACALELPPLVSASLVVQHTKDAPAQLVPLSTSQVAALNTWLSAHRAGWSSSYASYAPRVQARLEHADGQSSSLQLVASKVVVYGTFGQLERTLTAEEFNALARLWLPLPANPSLQPTCYGWLRQPSQASELKR